MGLKEAASRSIVTGCGHRNAQKRRVGLPFSGRSPGVVVRLSKSRRDADGVEKRREDMWVGSGLGSGRQRRESICTETVLSVASGRTVT